MCLVGLGNVREVLKDVFDGEVEGDLCSGVTPLDEVFDALVLVDELLLHAPPDDLDEALLFAQVSLHLLVQFVEAAANVFARVDGDDFPQLLLAVGQLEVNLGLFDTCRHQVLNAVEKHVQPLERTTEVGRHVTFQSLLVFGLSVSKKSSFKKWNSHK